MAFLCFQVWYHCTKHSNNYKTEVVHLIFFYNENYTNNTHPIKLDHHAEKKECTCLETKYKNWRSTKVGEREMPWHLKVRSFREIPLLLIWKVAESSAKMEIEKFWRDLVSQGNPWMIWAYGHGLHWAY